MSGTEGSFEKYLRKIINNLEVDYLIPNIIENFDKLTLHKNQLLAEKGKVCEQFCFIESGILQHAIEVNGEDKTTYLALKNSCTSSLESFLNGIPSKKTIKALSYCELRTISKEKFYQLKVTNKAFYQFYFNLIEQQIFLIDNYRIDLLTLTPEERYQKLLLNEPKLLQEVPLHYLASFMGISNRHMSRIRKNIK